MDFWDSTHFKDQVQGHFGMDQISCKAEKCLSGLEYQESDFQAFVGLWFFYSYTFLWDTLIVSRFWSM